MTSSVIVFNPYSPDSGVVLDDDGLLSPENFSGSGDSVSSASNNIVLFDRSAVGVAAAGVAVVGLAYTVSHSPDSEAVTVQIDDMINDLSGIIGTIVTLAITVLTVYYAFRIVGRLMP